MIQILLYTSLALLALVIISIPFLYRRFIFSYNADRVTALASSVAAFGGIFALLIFGLQASQLARQVELQADTASLEQRPQLYLVQRPPSPTCQNPICIWFNESEGAWYAGTDLHFRNVGKYPATITGADYKVLSDVRRKTDLVGWFKQVYGEMPGPKVVFPGQEDTVGVPSHPIVGGKSDPPRLLSF